MSNLRTPKLLAGVWKVIRLSSYILSLSMLIKCVDYEHTSLGPYVEMFEKHVAAILRDSRNAKRGKLADG